jgi:hypothetical protein
VASFGVKEAGILLESRYSILAGRGVASFGVEEGGVVFVFLRSFKVVMIPGGRIR